MRFSVPTIASSCAHFRRRLSFVDSLSVFDHFRKVRINPRPFLRLQINFRQPRLVINRNGGAVFPGLQDVVNLNVIAEYGLLSIGVPMKPMNDAFGNASRICLAKPSMKSYWLRCASSAMTTMLRRSESSGCFPLFLPEKISESW